MSGCGRECFGLERKQGDQRSLNEYHSLANRLETVRVLHWLITWPIYLTCTVAQGQSYCASNIISNSHPFHSKWVKPPIPELQQFQYFTLKIQGQGHGWGQSLKSQCESNILSTHIPFVPCQSAIPFLRYDFFKIWPLKSKVKVMEKVNIESHNMGPTFYRLTSLPFHVNRPSHSWHKTFSKFDLENPRSRSWVRRKLKVTTWVQYSIGSRPFHPMSIGHPIPDSNLAAARSPTRPPEPWRQYPLTEAPGVR